MKDAQLSGEVERQLAIMREGAVEFYGEAKSRGGWPRG